MQITEEQVGVVRAYLHGDHDAERRLDRVAASAVQGLAVLVTAAFVEALTRRFVESWARAEIVQLVASWRSRLGDHAVEIDPRRAETLIRTALGGGDPASLDDETKALQAHLLLLLVEDERLDTDAMESFLTDACTRAERLPVG